MDSILREKIGLTLILTLLLLLASCQEEETITPFANPQTVAQTQGRDPELTIVRGAFDFDELSVDSPIGGGNVPILGNFLNRLATAFANLFILINRDWEVEQEPMALEIPEIDSEIFINLSLKTLSLRIQGTDPNEKASLEFIENLDLYMATPEMLIRGESTLFARYSYNKAQLKRCKERCIDFELLKTKKEDIDHINLMPLIIEASSSDEKIIYIIPKIRINSIPKANFKIEGSVDFKLGFKLPF